MYAFLIFLITFKRLTINHAININIHDYEFIWNPLPSIFLRLEQWSLTIRLTWTVVFNRSVALILRCVNSLIRNIRYDCDNKKLFTFMASSDNDHHLISKCSGSQRITACLDLNFKEPQVWSDMNGVTTLIKMKLVTYCLNEQC